MLPGEYPYFDGEDTTDEDEDDDDDQPPQAVPLSSKRKALIAVRSLASPALVHDSKPVSWEQHSP